MEGDEAERDRGLVETQARAGESLMLLSSGPGLWKVQSRDTAGNSNQVPRGTQLQIQTAKKSEPGHVSCVLDTE